MTAQVPEVGPPSAGAATKRDRTASDSPPPAALAAEPADNGLKITSVRPLAEHNQQALAPRRPATHSYRFFRAYWTTFLVLGSYLWTFFLGRFFAQAWMDARLEVVHARNARRVVHTIVVLQGLFIKVGQLLSVLANFLPAPFRDGLASLQDRMPPRPTSEIKERIEGSLGRPMKELFSRFDDQPLASASLGQVHEAMLPDGRHVAVKVQHADIDEIVKLDLRTIRRIMMIVSRFVPASKNLDVYYRQIKAMIEEELDFEREARNIELIAKNFASDPTVVFPTPVPELSTRRVLVTTFVQGMKVSDIRRLDEANIDRPALARKIVETYCQMIFVDGVYHADPHPGNVLVGQNGELVLLDFGAVAELSRDMKEGIPELVEGVIRRDTDRLIRALKKMGFISRGSAEDVSERVVEFFHQRFQEDVKLESFNLKDIKLDPQRGIESLMSLRKMNIGLRELSEAFHVPRDWVFLERTLLLLTGVCTELDPEMQPVEIIHPYVQKFVLGNRDWAQIALEAAKDMALKAITLPDDLRKYLMRANRGEAEVKVRDLSRAASTVASSVRQLAQVILAVSLGGAALYLLSLGRPDLALYFGWGAGGIATLALLGMLFSRN
ncbi:MAG: AarF/ABC1/UbiB kinase family protein [Polyangiaceae bacterium]|nr:AarF/ABC1/UbiB kinase family protein [Polyangiaceae bacterium]